MTQKRSKQEVLLPALQRIREWLPLMYTDEDSTTSGILTLLVRHGSGPQELRKRDYFDRRDTKLFEAELTKGPDDVEEAALIGKVIDAASSAVRSVGFVGVRIRVNTCDNLAFNKWLCHSFVVVRCPDEEEDVVVDACAVAGLIRARPWAEWRQSLKMILEAITPGPNRATLWKVCFGLPISCPLFDETTTVGLKVQIFN
jgi:hypothetical protein